MYTCNTDNFPRLTCYTEALAHYERTKPYRGQSADASRPIGTRSHRNKQMIRRSDGSITYRLYNTDCVTYHPDGTVTVQGYASQSTTSFINALTPSGVYHAQGRSGYGEPVLHLMQDGDSWWVEDKTKPYTPSWGGEGKVYYKHKRNPDVDIIRCCQPVRLDYTAGRWLPTHPDDLEPFTMQTTDRAVARKVAKEFKLHDFECWINAIIALGGELPECVDVRGMRTVELFESIAEQLRDGNFSNALSLVPRGGDRWQRYRPFGGTRIEPTDIRPRFLVGLRDHIYAENDCVVTVKERVLSPSGYQRYLRGQKRFG